MQQAKFTISRKFTKPGSDIYEGIDFIEWTSCVMEHGGRSTDIRKVIAPSSWSQTAVDILAQKYLRRAGIPKFLKKIPESNVPKWLYRSEADELKMKEVEEQKDKYIGEDDARMIFHRLAGAWTYSGWKGGYFSSEEQAKTFYDEVMFMMIRQQAAPNSPQFFNSGIYWAYGIKGRSQGHYYYDPEDEILKMSTSAYERPQVHACFIQSLSDNLIEEGGIMDLAVRESRVFKFGSGSGTNFSSLRGKGEELSGGCKSSGLMSFLKIGDSVAGAIKSGGATRRAAKMVTVDVDHPEIVDYITWKVKEENKVISLITGSRIINKYLTRIVKAFKDSNRVSDLKLNPKLLEAVTDAYHNEVPAHYIKRVLDLLSQGVTDFDWEVFNSDFNGTAYSTVDGQNSNNSVRLSNDFMNCLIEDKDFKLVNRTNGQECGSVKAKYVWDKICSAAWLCADPGVQYDTTINEWHTCPNSGRINASNPCSEYMFLDDTACNLASINLVAFERGCEEFDTEAFAHAARIWTVVLEISVYMAQYPSARIAQLSHDFRTLGLGYANLGALLMRSGIPYDSPKGRALAAYITAVLHGIAYETSADLAANFGAFSGFEANRDQMLRVVENHRRAVLNQKCEGVTVQPVMLDRNELRQDQLNYLSKLWDRVIEKGRRHGYRNAQVTLLAPTGTCGLLMDCDTTGIEPDYAIVKHKKLSGGGYMKIINNSVEHALQAIGYTNTQVKEIIRYVIGSGRIDDCPGINSESLMKVGFSEADIKNVNEALGSAFSISSVFSPWVLGEETMKRLMVPQERIYDETFSLLEFCGFTSDAIHSANLATCGHMCIEGAPHIKDEHLAIFDCANKNGIYGKRFIHVDGHLRMMASVQPFLSGAISKTVNMPSEATIADCSDVYFKGWEWGLKAIALFRSSSKLASALDTGNAGILSFGKPETKKQDELPRGVREILPPRRKGYTQRVTIGGEGNIFYHTTGENQDGDVREIFVTGGDKEGTPFRSIMNCFAKAVSIGLQYGVPVEVMIESFTHVHFPPNGLVYGHDHIRFAHSLVDYMLRDIGIRYRNMRHLGHAFSKDSNDSSDSQSKEEQKYSGYSGDVCSHCGSFRMVRDGACMCCAECGTTTGCG